MQPIASSGTSSYSICFPKQNHRNHSTVLSMTIPQTLKSQMPTTVPDKTCLSQKHNQVQLRMKWSLI